MKKEQKSPTKTKKKLLVTIGILIGVYILAIFTPIVSPFAKYPFDIIRCGGKPIIGSLQKAGKKYYLPGDQLYTLYPSSETFCTEEQAQAVGYTSDNRSRTCIKVDEANQSISNSACE